MILTYHAIEKPVDEAGNELYCVSLEKFKEQIEYLRRTPYAVRDTNPTITFDDGDITNYTHAYAILKENGLKAYFFILVSKVGTQGYMNWQQVKELRAAGMTIGSHGMTHRILTVLSEKEMDYELKDSKKILEENLGQAIEYFSVPRGFYNHKLIAKAKEAGYNAVFTSNPGDDDNFLLGRIAVKANWDLTRFTRVVNHGLSSADLAAEFIKNLVKKLLGADNYDKIRSNLVK